MVSGSIIPHIATDDAPMNFPVASLAIAAAETPLEFLDKAAPTLMDRDNARPIVRYASARPLPSISDLAHVFYLY